MSIDMIRSMLVLAKKEKQMSTSHSIVVVGYKNYLALIKIKILII